jgi:hypothetical protein
MQLSGTWVSLSLCDCGVLYIQFLLLYLWIFCFPSSTSAGDAAKVDLLKSLPNAANRLVLFQADIYNPTDFEPAIKGCEYVFHVATPMRHDTQSSLVCHFQTFYISLSLSLHVKGFYVYF